MSLNDPSERILGVENVNANAMEGDRERCIEAGMNDYLSKPIKSTSLATALLKARDIREGK